jgi:hypothetical protein
MAKLTTTDISNITGAESVAISTINNNFAAVETALENTLSRDGTTPNTMSADLDMNSNDIMNVGTLEVVTLNLGGEEFTGELFAQGDDGWSPVLATVSSGSNIVLQITGYVGGEGTAPTEYVGYYIGSSGPVAAIGDAVNIRGAQGQAGVGSGDIVSTNNGSDFASAATTFSNLKQAASTTATGVVELATDAETQTGTDTARAITPANLTAKEATTANWRANTADRILTTDVVWSAMAEVVLTDGATVTPDFSTGFDFALTLGGNRTLAAPTNIKTGQRGRFRLQQDATGSRTITLNSVYKTAGGASVTLSTAANSVDYLDYDVVNSGHIRVSLSKAWS